MELETEPATIGTGRRRFLTGAGMSAAALAVALSFPGRLLAQEDGQEGEGDGATAPEGPEEADFLAFAESVELAVAEVESTIAGRIGGDSAAQLQAFAGHHRSHAAEIAKGAGAKAKGAANALLVGVLDDQIAQARGTEDLLDIVIDLENTLAATHLSLTRLVETAGVLTLIGTILPVEAEHAAALGLRAGRELVRLFPDGGDADPDNSFETQRKALDPAVFPIEPTEEAS